MSKVKVGRDLSSAFFATPNKTMRFAAMPPLGVPVQRGMTHDGLSKYLSRVVVKVPGPITKIVSILKETGTDMIVNACRSERELDGPTTCPSLWPVPGKDMRWITNEC